MKRRDFLKLLPAAVALPAVLITKEIRRPPETVPSPPEIGALGHTEAHNVIHQWISWLAEQT